MRVAYVCADPGVPVFGHKGCSVHVREMCSTMREAGCDVTLFAARRGGEAPASLRDLPFVALPAPTASRPEERELEAVAANEQVMRTLDAAGRFDVIYERASLWTVSPMLHAARTSAAGILELNAPLVDEQAKYRTIVNTAVARALLSSSLRTARLVAAVSDGVAAWATDLSGATANVHVVPNGVDPRRFASRRAVGPARDRFTIGFVGTLKPWHGLATLVDAFAQLVPRIPDAHLLIVGDGPERDIVEKRMTGHGLADRLTVTGAVPHDAVPSFLEQMDVAVAPYPRLDDFYFSPLKLTEYMAAALPVVASAIGQVTSLVRHDETGLLFTPGDATGAAHAIHRLHADAALRDRLGSSARAFVTAHCTWTHALDRILNLAGVAAASFPRTLPSIPCLTARDQVGRATAGVEH